MKRSRLAHLSILILATLSLAFMFGCSTGPSADLQLYEKSLNPLDQALYTQHQQLMTDAVAKGIRTTSEQQIVTIEISQAQALHAKALSTTATTQP